jgi:exo-beta-1,3-glucanase (GH17 family)
LKTYVTLKDTHYLKEGDVLEEVKNATDAKSVYVCNGIYYEEDIIKDTTYFRMIDKKYPTDDFHELNTGDTAYIVYEEGNQAYQPIVVILGDYINKVKAHRLFKHKDNADKFIINKKPCLSLFDITLVMKTLESADYEKLANIVKSRI